MGVIETLSGGSRSSFSGCMSVKGQFFFFSFNQSNVLNEDAEQRIQLSSAKSDIKKICKNVKRCHSSNFCFEKLTLNKNIYVKKKTKDLQIQGLKYQRNSLFSCIIRQEWVGRSG